MKNEQLSPRNSALTAFGGRARRWVRNWRAFFAVLGHFTLYLRGRLGRMGFALVMTLGYAAMRILEPWPIKLVIDHVLLGYPLSWSPWPTFLTSENGVERLLYLLVAVILVTAVLRGFFYYRQKLAIAELGIAIIAELRLDLYRHIQHLSLGYHDRRRTGDTIVRLTSDIRILRGAFVSLPLELIESALLMSGMAVVMLVMDWKLALVALALAPVLYMLVRIYRRPMAKAAREQRKREGNLATMASETLGAIKVVQGFRREKAEIKRFGGANRRSQRSEVKMARYEAKLRWSTELAIAVATGVVVLFASLRILETAMSPGDLIVFITYLRIYARPMRRMSGIVRRMSRASAAGERVLEVLATESPVQDLPDAIKAPRFQGRIVFDNVSFAYGGDQAVLSDINLDIAPGERVAIVGPTGSGKSSLVSLISRFYDPTAGRLVIDGEDVRRYTLSSLRRQVSIVFQEPVLFATTVAENIAYGKPDASMDEIEDAVRRAGIDGVIAHLPDGFDTVLGERGGTLSGGQRQCVAIARAMIRNSPIIILDELTTGLDPESSALVLRAVENLTKGRTVLSISHDLESVENADRVVVLSQGRVVEEGDYASLIESDGLFRKLQQRQAR